MALIKCPECGKEISDKAKQCPQCGWKVKLKDKFATANNEEKQIVDISFEKNEDCNELVGKEDKIGNSVDLESKTDNNNAKTEKKNNFILYMIIIAVITVAMSAFISSIVASQIVVKKMKKISLSNESSVSEEVVTETTEENIESVEKADVKTNKEVSELEPEVDTDSEIEEIQEEKNESGSEQKIESDSQDLILENGIVINREKTNYKSDIYNIVNAKITSETEDYYEIGFIMYAQKIDTIFSDVQLQCLDEDGFEIKRFYLSKPASVGEFTESSKIPKETKKIQICSEK